MNRRGNASLDSRRWRTPRAERDDLPFDAPFDRALFTTVTNVAGTHPTEERKLPALNLPGMITRRSPSDDDDGDEAATPEEITELLRESWWTTGGSNS
jgi:hypothetical protein